MREGSLHWRNLLWKECLQGKAEFQHQGGSEMVLWETVIVQVAEAGQ